MRSNRQVLFLSIAFVGVLFAVVLAVTSCGSNADAGIKRAIQAGNGAVATSTDVYQVTPRGASVYGNKAMSTEQLAAVDEGLTQFFDAARADGLKNRVGDYGFYQIFTPPYACQLSPVSRTPSFLVRGDYYDGTEWDQYNPKGVGVKDGIGVTFAAELILSLGTPGSSVEAGQMYVCPDLPVLIAAARHGADHIGLANDINAYPDGNTYFYCSLYHFDQGFGVISHPLVPRNGRCTNSNFLPSMMRQDLPFIEAVR